MVELKPEKKDDDWMHCANLLSDDCDNLQT